MSEYLDIKDAATASNLSVAWWRAKIFRREVPFYRVGGKILISRKDLENLMVTSRVEPKIGGSREGCRDQAAIKERYHPINKNHK